MARRSSGEEEKDAGNPVEPTEYMPEPDTSDQFGEDDYLFAGVGSGKPSEMRDITDKQLQALNSPEFPVADAMPDELKELDDADDWEEPEDRLDEADSDDEDEDD